MTDAASDLWTWLLRLILTVFRDKNSILLLKKEYLMKFFRGKGVIMPIFACPLTPAREYVQYARPR